MKIAVIGGTGSFGRAFVHKYYDEHELTVISRDELKQHQMRLEYPNVTYLIGDIRDRDRMFELLHDFDGIFQAAALKQVPNCEEFPFEAVKTNVLGTNNVLDAAKGTKIVCLSTDKAVYPVNAMGISKAMMEKVALNKGAVVTRYGNVMKSRGSVIPLWQELASKGEPLKITNPKMTRFLMSLDESIDLVMEALTNGKPGQIYIRKAPACDMGTLADAISKNQLIVGERPGEKVHETLISSEEMTRVIDNGQYYIIDNVKHSDNCTPYTSDNTQQLALSGVMELLRSIE